MQPKDATAAGPFVVVMLIGEYVLKFQFSTTLFPYNLSSEHDTSSLTPNMNREVRKETEVRAIIQGHILLDIHSIIFCELAKFPTISPAGGVGFGF